MACNARTKAGKPCGAPELPGRGWCFTHDPEQAKARAKARRKGGLSVHFGREAAEERLTVSIHTMSDVLELLQIAADDCLTKKPSLQRARALVCVSLAALKAVEVTGLEERLSALEARTIGRMAGA